MPRLTRAPAYRKHATGQAFVVLNGEHHYLGKYGTAASKENYERLIAQWKASHGILISKNATTVVEMAAAFVRHAQGYYVKNGKTTCEVDCIRSAMKSLCKLYGRTPAEQFGPVALDSVRQQMIDAGYSRGFINRSIQRIRRAFKWAGSREMVSASVYHSLMTLDGLKRGRTKAKDYPPVMPVAREVALATADHAKKPVGDMIRLQLETGCRPGEVCSMKPGEIDRSGEIWIYRPSSHKMEHAGRGRIIPIGPQAQKILLPYLLRGPDEFCFLKPRAKKPYERWDYGQSVHLACDRAFPPPDGMSEPEKKTWRKQHRWAPNRLRHTAATEIRALHGIEASQVVLGHSSLETTLVYAERDLAKAIEIARHR